MRTKRCLIYFLVGFFLISCTAVSPATPTETPIPTANPSNNIEQVVKDYREANETRNLVKIISLFAENAIFEDPAYGDYFTNREKIGEMYRWLYSLPDVKLETTSSFISDDGRYAVVEWVWSGTHESQPYSTRGVSILEIEEGKIVHETIYYDRTW